MTIALPYAFALELLVEGYLLRPKVAALAEN